MKTDNDLRKGAAEQDFFYFDKLPPEVRSALYGADVKYCSHTLFVMLRCELTPEQMIRNIAQMDDRLRAVERQKIDQTR